MKKLLLLAGILSSLVLHAQNPLLNREWLRGYLLNTGATRKPEPVYPTKIKEETIRKIGYTNNGGESWRQVTINKYHPLGQLASFVQLTAKGDTIESGNNEYDSENNLLNTRLRSAGREFQTIYYYDKQHNNTGYSSYANGQVQSVYTKEYDTHGVLFREIKKYVSGPGPEYGHEITRGNTGVDEQGNRFVEIESVYFSAKTSSTTYTKFSLNKTGDTLTAMQYDAGRKEKCCTEHTIFNTRGEVAGQIVHTIKFRNVFLLNQTDNPESTTTNITTFEVEYDEQKRPVMKQVTTREGESGFVNSRAKTTYRYNAEGRLQEQVEYGHNNQVAIKLEFEYTYY